jgi:predicted HicB family RNase H-like nuclease
MPDSSPKKSPPAGKRINIYMKTGVHEAATKRAFEQNMSFSAYLEQLIVRSAQRTKSGK